MVIALPRLRFSSAVMQVAAACQRVAGLRATVPNQIAQQLTQHLQQCRPASHDTPDGSPRDGQPAMLDAMSPTAAIHSSFSASELVSNPAVSTEEAWPGPQANALSMTPLSPAPAELQSMYTAAVQRMPALRCVLQYHSTCQLSACHNGSSV